MCSFQNDGNVWMAADILTNTDNSGRWNEKITTVPKPSIESLRVSIEHWPQENLTPTDQANKQGQLTESRFGTAGTWLRFFPQSPELDPQAENSGGARAISYQILRYGLTSSEDSTPKYQLFRSDVSDINTLNAGYNLHQKTDLIRMFRKMAHGKLGISKTQFIKIMEKNPQTFPWHLTS